MGEADSPIVTPVNHLRRDQAGHCRPDSYGCAFLHDGPCLWLLLVCLVAPAALIVAHIHENPEFSPIDEAAHWDYVTRIANGGFPRLGQRLQPSTLRTLACRKTALSKPVAPPCSQRILRPDQFAGGGYQYEAQQPPVYYAVTVPDALGRHEHLPHGRRRWHPRNRDRVALPGSFRIVDRGTRSRTSTPRHRCRRPLARVSAPRRLSGVHDLEWCSLDPCRLGCLIVSRTRLAKPRAMDGPSPCSRWLCRGRNRRTKHLGGLCRLCDVRSARHPKVQLIRATRRKVSSRFSPRLVARRWRTLARRIGIGHSLDRHQ